MAPPTFTMTTTAAPEHIFEAPTISTLSLGVFPKSTKEEFKCSFGPKWDVQVGKYTLWDLTGRAEATWTRILFPRAMDILRNHPIDPRKCHTSDRPSASLCGWMVGIDSEHAHPTMVVISEDKGYRDEALRLMKKKKVLKETGFRVMALASRIDRDAGSPTMGLSNTFEVGKKFRGKGPRDDHDMSQKSFRLPVPAQNLINSRSPSSNSGSVNTATYKINYREIDDSIGLAGLTVSTSSAKATIGGQIWINGQDFGVTVAHIFDPPARNTAMKLTFDDDGFSEDSEDTASSDDEQDVARTMNTNNLQIPTDLKIPVTDMRQDIRSKTLINYDSITTSKARNNAFDWPEPLSAEKPDEVGRLPRTKNDPTREASDKRNSRAGGRSALHVRSQSVSAAHDSSKTFNKPYPAPKFGTWGLGSKQLGDEWDNDFEFDSTIENLDQEEAHMKSSGMILAKARTIEAKMGADKIISESDALMVDRSIDYTLIPRYKIIDRQKMEVDSILDNPLTEPPGVSAKLPDLVKPITFSTNAIRAGEVLNAMGGKQILTCKFYPSLSAIKPEGSDNYTDVHSVQLNKPLSPGNCGAWFVHKTSGSMAGMVISGCKPLKMAFLLPGEALQKGIQDWASSPISLTRPSQQSYNSIDYLPTLQGDMASNDKRNHALKRHKRIHLAVKPFSCSRCQKSFSRKDSLKRHMLVEGCRSGIAANPTEDSTDPGKDSAAGPEPGNMEEITHAKALAVKFAEVSKQFEAQRTELPFQAGRNEEEITKIANDVTSKGNMVLNEVQLGESRFTPSDFWDTTKHIDKSNPKYEQLLKEIDDGLVKDIIFISKTHVNISPPTQLTKTVLGPEYAAASSEEIEWPIPPRQATAEQLNDLIEQFDRSIVPQAQNFTTNTPKDSSKRMKEHNILREAIIKEILNRLENLDFEEDLDLRQKARELVMRGHICLDWLDEAAGKTIDHIDVEYVPLAESVRGTQESDVQYIEEHASRSRSTPYNSKLVKALESAKSAVWLDKHQASAPAIRDYSQCCSHIDEVIDDNSVEKYQDTLSAIRTTYTARIVELKRLFPSVSIQPPIPRESSLPLKPTAKNDSKGHVSITSTSKDEPAVPKTPAQGEPSRIYGTTFNGGLGPSKISTKNKPIIPQEDAASEGNVLTIAGERARTNWDEDAGFWADSGEDEGYEGIFDSEDRASIGDSYDLTPVNPSQGVKGFSRASKGKAIAGVRCGTCASNGQESWVLLGSLCGYCGTAC